MGVWTLGSPASGSTHPVRVTPSESSTRPSRSVSSESVRPVRVGPSRPSHLVRVEISPECRLLVAWSESFRLVQVEVSPVPVSSESFRLVRVQRSSGSVSCPSRSVSSESRTFKSRRLQLVRAVFSESVWTRGLVTVAVPGIYITSFIYPSQIYVG